jgi:hypothetical protein
MHHVKRRRASIQARPLPFIKLMHLLPLFLLAVGELFKRGKTGQSFAPYFCPFALDLNAALLLNLLGPASVVGHSDFLDCAGGFGRRRDGDVGLGGCAVHEFCSFISDLNGFGYPVLSQASTFSLPLTLVGDSIPLTTRTY